MSGGVKIFITVSVLLNLFLGGVMLGSFISSNNQQSRADAIMAMADTSSLDDAGKSELKKLLSQYEDARSKAHKARDESIKIIVAPEFDRAAYMATVEKMFSARDQQKKYLAEAISNLASAMNQAGREDLADLLKQPPQWSKP